MRNEKIFPSLFLGLMHNSARSFTEVGKKGSEPTIGNDGIAGGKLWPLWLTFCRRYNKYVTTNTAPNTSHSSVEDSLSMCAKTDDIFASKNKPTDNFLQHGESSIQINRAIFAKSPTDLKILSVAHSLLKLAKRGPKPFIKRFHRTLNVSPRVPYDTL